MRFLVIGLGSMGKRRIRNLLFHKIAVQDIAGFDLSAERCAEVKKEYQVQTFADFKQADAQIKPDVYIICTPPHLHAPYFLHAARHQKHFFVEVATTDQGYDELIPLIKKAKFVAAPSCTYRYFAPIRKMKALLDAGKIGRVEAFAHHMGQYLPDWHPWEDYRKFYVSQAKSSACREMVPFELQWLQWLMSVKFTQALGLTAKCSDLDISINDTYAAVLKSKTGVLGTLLVDVISRHPYRSLRILGSTGVIEWDWQANLIKLFSAQTKKWRLCKVAAGQKKSGYLTTTEEMYYEELRVFLDAVKGRRQYPYTFIEDRQNLKLLQAIETSITRK